MGKRYFYFDHAQPGTGWEQHAWKVNQEGVNREGAEDTPAETQTVYGQDGRSSSRRHHPDSAVGLDSTDVHHAGDRVTITDEVPEFKGGRPTGDLLQYGHRYTDSGGIETREYRWAKTAEGRHILVGSRVIRSY